MKSKSGFWAWCSIDFANSLLYTNLVLYLPTWLTIDNGISDLHYNIIFIGSTIFALIFAPVLGINGDKNNKRLYYLKTLNFIMLILGFLIAILGLNTSSQIWAYVVGVLFMLLNSSYLLSLQFYDSMLPDFQSNDGMAKGSAIGFSMGWIGAIVGVLAVIPIASQGTSESRLYAILAATVFSAVVLIPSLLRLKQNQITSNNIKENAETPSFKIFFSLMSKKHVMLFLVAYFLFMDSIFTIQDNLSIYLERVFGLGDDVKGLFAVGIIIAGVVGALSTMAIKKSNTIYRWILILVITSSVFVISSSIMNTSYIAMVMLVLAFLVFGGIISLSRAYFSKISDIQYRSTSFSWYSIAQKSSSLIGPLIWGSVVAGTSQYNIALSTMGVLMLISIFPIVICMRSTK